MGMSVDLRTGESLVAFKKGDELFKIRITMEKKLGNSVARLTFEADKEIVLIPPNKQK